MSSGSGNVGAVPPAVTRRYHRVIRDFVKTIQPQVFKAQLSDTSDITMKKKIAPRTKKEMCNYFFENLENYFVTPGRKLPGRPLQKLVERQFDALRKEMKNIAGEDEIRPVEPLSEDLRTSTSADVPSLVHDMSPAKLNTFPKRNSGDVRRSYAKRTPKKPLPISTFVVKNDNSSTNYNNIIIQGPSYDAQSETIVRIAPQMMTTYATRSRSRSPTKIVASSSSDDKEVLISGDPIPMEIELTNIPQYSHEISVDASGVISEHNTVNSNVLDLSDLIQSNETQIDGKIEIASNDLVLCTSIDEMNEVIVMGENGERYRFVALNDGQLSLVPESSVQ